MLDNFLTEEEEIWAMEMLSCTRMLRISNRTRISDEKGLREIKIQRTHTENQQEEDTSGKKV